jgi:hypothetical protein
MIWHVVLLEHLLFRITNEHRQLGPEAEAFHSFYFLLVFLSSPHGICQSKFGKQRR